MIEQQPTVVGEIGNSPEGRVLTVTGALREAGFPTTIERDIEGWLSSHAALVVPMAAAITAAAGRASLLADRISLRRPAIQATRAIYQAQRRQERLVINFNLRLLYLVMPEWFAVRYWSRCGANSVSWHSRSTPATPGAKWRYWEPGYARRPKPIRKLSALSRGNPARCGLIRNAGFASAGHSLH